MNDYKSMIVYGKTGPQQLGDGVISELRTERQGGLLISGLHGKYTQAALDCKLFYSYSAARATSVPATAQIGQIVWNPPGSGVNLAFLKWSAQVQVTSATTLGLTFGYSAQATVPTTTTVADASGCTMISGPSPRAKAYAIATIITAPTPIYLLMHNTAAINTVGVDQVDGDFEGMFVCPPGYLVAISAITAAVAAAGMTSTLTWEEVPI